MNTSQPLLSTRTTLLLFLFTALFLASLFFVVTPQAEAVTWGISAPDETIELWYRYNGAIEDYRWGDDNDNIYTDPPYDIVVTQWNEVDRPTNGYTVVPGNVCGFWAAAAFEAHTDKYTYDPGQSVTIYGSHQSGCQWDHVRIQASVDGGGWNAVYGQQCFGGSSGGLFPDSWSYCNAPSPTSWTFSAPSSPGTYQIDLMGDISYIMWAGTAIWIEVAAPPPAQPILDVSPDIDFGTVPVGETRSDAFYVSNAGSGNLSGDVAFSPVERTLAQMEEGERGGTAIAHAAGSEGGGTSPAASGLSFAVTIAAATALLIFLRSGARKISALFS